MLVSTLLVSGCQSPSPVISDANSPKHVTTTGIDPKDLENAAEAMVGDIKSKGVLDRIKPGPAVIGVSTIKNNTGARFDTAFLTGKIMTDLNQSGKAITMLNIGVGPDGNPIYQDVSGAAQGQQDRFLNDTQVAPRPDFTLSGVISEAYASRDGNKDFAYTIHLQLSRGDLVAWTYEHDIGKHLSGPHSIGR